MAQVCSYTVGLFRAAIVSSVLIYKHVCTKAVEWHSKKESTNVHDDKARSPNQMLQIHLFFRTIHMSLDQKMKPQKLAVLQIDNMDIFIALMCECGVLSDVSIYIFNLNGDFLHPWMCTLEVCAFNALLSVLLWSLIWVINLYFLITYVD